MVRTSPFNFFGKLSSPVHNDAPRDSTVVQKRYSLCQLQSDGKTVHRIARHIVGSRALLKRVLQGASVEPLKHQEGRLLSVVDKESRAEGVCDVGVSSPLGYSLVDSDFC